MAKLNDYETLEVLKANEAVKGNEARHLKEVRNKVKRF